MLSTDDLDNENKENNQLYQVLHFNSHIQDRGKVLIIIFLSVRNLIIRWAKG